MPKQIRGRESLDQQFNPFNASRASNSGDAGVVLLTSAADTILTFDAVQHTRGMR